MKNNQIIIPEGWTYFAHRTNTERWENDPFNESLITVNKLMSVITEDDIYREVRHYGKNHLQGYSTGKGVPFEIRCLICSLPYLSKLDNESNIKNIMMKEFYYDRRNFGGCAGQRHHSIPKDEQLMVIGVGEYDEVYERNQKIIWTIPKRFLEIYKNDIMKNNNRIINLESLENEYFKKR